ncbi:MAG: hypothetical protein WD578_01505 [Bacteroidales bacterium]
MGHYIPTIITALMFVTSCSLNDRDDQLNETNTNHQAALLYHELNPLHADSILTKDFIGQREKNLYTWDFDDHKKYLANGRFKRDSVYQQVTEGDWVATRFFRECRFGQDTVIMQMMHFKRFENGKIAEIWEYGNKEQLGVN